MSKVPQSSLQPLADSTAAPATCSDSQTSLAQLCECGRLFHARGWSAGTSGNYSVVTRREPLELMVTASGEEKGKLDYQKFVRIDATGVPAAQGQPRASAETLLHVTLAKVPGTGAILHTHSVWGTLLSEYHFYHGGLSICGYEMLKGLEGVTTHEQRIWVPIFDNTQDIPALAEQVRQELARSDRQMEHGFLIRNHGLYTWAPDIATARRQVEVFEFLFEVLGRKTDFRYSRDACVANDGDR